jgi:nitroreductase
MELSETIDTRRAYRSLDPVPITEDIVRELGEAAIMAATCSNNQPARFVFVTDPAVLDEMQSALTRGNVWAQPASMIIAVFSHVDYDCKIRGRQYYLFGTGMETAHLMLKATDLGLVAHPIAGYDEDKVKTILGIPDDMQVITLIIVGKKSDTISPLLNEGQIEREKNRPERLPQEKFMAINHFDKALVKEPRK